MSNIQPEGERIRRAVRWIGETIKERGEVGTTASSLRKSIIEEAERLFDLTPLECEFLEKRLSEGSFQDE